MLVRACKVRCGTCCRHELQYRSHGSGGRSFTAVIHSAETAVFRVLPRVRIFFRAPPESNPCEYSHASYFHPARKATYCDQRVCMSLISVQRHRNTRSSSVVTLARPPTSSSLKTTDRCFRYASQCLWN